MHITNKSLLGIFIAGCVLVAGLAVFIFFGCSEKWCGFLGGDTQIIVIPSQVRNFEDCVANGNPVMESYPRRCLDGKITFVETIPSEVVDDSVTLTNIQPNQLVTSPLEVAGKAPGNWFFEANIGLRLLDALGAEVARGHATATSDWMSSDEVPFTGSISFTLPTSTTGFVEIEKDNPSDKRELDASVRIPVRFK